MSSVLQLNENVKKILNSNEDYNYNDWLLRPNKSFNLRVEKETKANSVIFNKSESFEDLSSNQGEIFEMFSFN